MYRDTWTVRISKKWATLIIGCILGAAIAAPAIVYASDRFVDVPTTNTFHKDITWLADSGVTLGCNPPANDRYCPNDNVTRGQMAAFLRRLAEKRVVDAATLEGISASGFVAKGEAGSISQSMLQTNSVASAAVANNTLLAADLRDEPGLASNSKTTKVPGTAFETYATVAIDAPGAGYAFVSATGYAQCSDGFLAYRIGAPGLGEASFFNAVGFSANVYQSYHNQYVFTVDAAGVVSFELQGNHTTGNCSDGGVSDLTVIYFPTAYGTLGGHSSDTADQTLAP